MRKYLVLIVAVSLLAGTVGAEVSKVGSAGAQFLKIGVGSKYQAMGEASVAVANDVYAAYWNPAGLAEIEHWAVGFTNVNWILDVDLNYVSAAKRFEGLGVVGFSVAVMSTGEQEVTTVDQQDGTGEMYTSTSYAIGVSYARNLTTKFAFGGTVKFIGERIGQVDSRGFGFDFGTTLYTGFNSLRLGMAIANIGPDLEFSGNALDIAYDGQGNNGSNAPVDAELKTSPYNLPLTFRFGMAYDFPLAPKYLMTVSGEFKHPNDNEQRASVGVQLGYDEKFFIRGGHKFNYDEETFALGGGIDAKFSGDTRIQIDYSWQDFGRLDATQRFSIGFSF